jgi:plastocyanin
MMSPVGIIPSANDVCLIPKPDQKEVLMSSRSLAALLASVALGGCATGASDVAHPPPKPSQQDAYVAKPDVDGVQRVSVRAGSYLFKPSYIVAKVNTPVELLASRERGIVPHNIVIRDQDAGIVVEQELATEPSKIAFTPKKVGKYAFYCTKKPPFGASHRDRGMEGILEVVP